MKPVITTAGFALALALLVAAPGFAKPKDRGMNQGEDQATYCKREHPGDEVACCTRGQTRNIERSCCKESVEGIEGEEPVCSGGDANAIWQDQGFDSLGECVDA